MRECNCAGAIGKIETLRNERRYHIHSFQGLDVGALYRVVSRFTDTTIEVETAGNGTDRHVVVSKESAELIESDAKSSSHNASESISTSWFTLRNMLALFMAIASLSNLLITTGFLSTLSGWVLGSHSTLASAATAASAAKMDASATDTSEKPAAATPNKSGFSLF